MKLRTRLVTRLVYKTTHDLPTYKFQNLPRILKQQNPPYHLNILPRTWKPQRLWYIVRGYTTHDALAWCMMSGPVGPIVGECKVIGSCTDLTPSLRTPTGTMVLLSGLDSRKLNVEPNSTFPSLCAWLHWLPGPHRRLRAPGPITSSSSPPSTLGTPSPRPPLLHFLHLLYWKIFNALLQICEACFVLPSSMQVATTTTTTIIRATQNGFFSYSPSPTALFKFNKPSFRFILMTRLQ